MSWKYFPCCNYFTDISVSKFLIKHTLSVVFDQLMMADNIRSWFLHLSPETRQRLLQNLLDHDQRWRVDYREGLAKKVESDMICMMDQLRELIEKEEPLFKGKMLQCGSSYNRTKVFVYSILGMNFLIK